MTKARGIGIDGDAITHTLEFVDAMPPQSTSSMQRDVIAGRPSEVEAILGSVIRLGVEGEVPTPAMSYLYASLMPMELNARKTCSSLPMDKKWG